MLEMNVSGRAGNSLRALSYALGAAAIAGIALSAIQARAQDAMWLMSPGSNDFNTATNWNPATVPGSVNQTGTASFGTSNVKNISISADTTVSGFTFNAGASNFQFVGGTLTFNGAGIVINGGGASFSNININFNNKSTAGGAQIEIARSMHQTNLTA